MKVVALLSEPKGSSSRAPPSHYTLYSKTSASGFRNTLTHNTCAVKIQTLFITKLFTHIHHLIRWKQWWGLRNSMSPPVFVLNNSLLRYISPSIKFTNLFKVYILIGRVGRRGKREEIWEYMYMYS